MTVETANHVGGGGGGGGISTKGFFHSLYEGQHITPMAHKISNPPPLWLCSHVLYIRHIIFLLHVKIRYCKKLHLRFDNYIVFTLSGGSEWVLVNTPLTLQQ